MTSEEFNTTLARLGLGYPQAAELLGVWRSATHKWGTGQRHIPHSVELSLNLIGAMGGPEKAKAKAEAWGRGNKR